MVTPVTNGKDYRKGLKQVLLAVLLFANAKLLWKYGLNIPLPEPSELSQQSKYGFLLALFVICVVVGKKFPHWFQPSTNPDGSTAVPRSSISKAFEAMTQHWIIWTIALVLMMILQLAVFPITQANA